MKFIFSIICGIDMIVALISFALLSYIFHIPWDWKLLCWSIVFAHAPDGSMVVYKFTKPWVIKIFDIPSHRPLTHHPLIVIPMAVLFCYIAAPILGYPVIMFILLAVIDLLGHFIHDSIEPQGFHWLSPFSWKRITLKNFFPKFVPEKVWKHIHWEKDKQYSKDSGSEFTKRADPLPGLQVFIWGITVALIICVRFFPTAPVVIFAIWGVAFVSSITITKTKVNYPDPNVNRYETTITSIWAKALLAGGYAWTGFWFVRFFTHLSTNGM